MRYLSLHLSQECKYYCQFQASSSNRLTDLQERE